MEAKNYFFTYLPFCLFLTEKKFSFYLLFSHLVIEIENFTYAFFSFYLMFSHLVIEIENFTYAFFYLYIFSNSLLIYLLFKSLKTNIWSNIVAVYTFIPQTASCFSILNRYWSLKQWCLYDWFIIVSVLILRIGLDSFITLFY